MFKISPLIHNVSYGIVQAKRQKVFDSLISNPRRSWLAEFYQVLRIWPPPGVPVSLLSFSWIIQEAFQLISHFPFLSPSLHRWSCMTLSKCHACHTTVLLNTLQGASSCLEQTQFSRSSQWGHTALGLWLWPLHAPHSPPFSFSSTSAGLDSLTLDQMRQHTPMSRPLGELSLSLGGSTTGMTNQIIPCPKQICSTSASGPTSKGILAHQALFILDKNRLETFMLGLCITNIWKCKDGLFHIIVVPISRTEQFPHNGIIPIGKSQIAHSNFFFFWFPVK